MKKINFKKLFLISSLVFSISACTKSSKDLTDSQQQIVNNTELPSDADVPSGSNTDPTPANPAPVTGPIAAPSPSFAEAISCRMTVLPSLVDVDQNGQYTSHLEIGTTEYCVGKIATGGEINSVNEFVKFENSDLFVQIDMNRVPSHLENPGNSSSYKIQFYTLVNNQYVPEGSMHSHRLQIKPTTPSAWKEIIRKGHDKYLLICSVKSACDQ